MIIDKRKFVSLFVCRRTVLCHTNALEQSSPAELTLEKWYFFTLTHSPEPSPELSLSLKNETNFGTRIFMSRKRLFFLPELKLTYQLSLAHLHPLRQKSQIKIIWHFLPLFSLSFIWFGSAKHSRWCRLLSSSRIYVVLVLIKVWIIHIKKAHTSMSERWSAGNGRGKYWKTQNWEKRVKKFALSRVSPVFLWPLPKQLYWGAHTTAHTAPTKIWTWRMMFKCRGRWGKFLPENARNVCALCMHSVWAVKNLRWEKNWKIQACDSCLRMRRRTRGGGRLSGYFKY